jgi:hypothetical protein
MNYSRVAMAAIAATVADFVFGFVVYGNLLTSSFLAQSGIYRAAEAQMAYMPVGAAGLAVAMFAATILFANSPRPAGLASGLAFGFLLAVFTIGTCVIVNFATLNMTTDHAVKMGVAALAEWLVVGAVIGLVYRPTGR